MSRRLLLLIVALAACSSPSLHQSRLGKVNVQRSEVPAGWAHPLRTAAGERELLSQRTALSACLGAATQTAHEDSPRFASGAQSISSIVYSYSSAGAVSDLVAALQGGKAQSCYRQVVEQSLVAEAAGTTVGSDSLQVQAGSPGSPLVASVFASVSFTRPGSAPATTSFDLYEIAQGTHLVEVRFASGGAAVDSGLEQRIVAAVQARAAASF